MMNIETPPAGSKWPIKHPMLWALACLLTGAVLSSCAALGNNHAARPVRVAFSGRSDAHRGFVLPLGSEVDSLAAGGGYVWAFVRDTGELMRVNQLTGQVRRFPLTAWRGLPVAAAANAQGVWLANQAATRPELIRVASKTGRIVARLRLPGLSGPIMGLAAAYGRLWALVPGGPASGWRVICVNPATNSVDGISASATRTHPTGDTEAISASAGKLWITGTMNAIVSLNIHTLAMHVTPTRWSGVLSFGDGRAWLLDPSGPHLAQIDPGTGLVARILATPPPSETGDDYVVAGYGVLWVFRGGELTEINPSTGRVIFATRTYPMVHGPVIITRTGLWYLAQADGGLALNHVVTGDF